MIHGEIFSRLIIGDSQVVDDFIRAKYLWDKFFNEKEISLQETSKLSRNLLSLEITFTEEFGNRLGVTLFVLSGLYQFHPFNGQNENLVKSLLQETQESGISSESKMLFRDYGKEENLI